MFEIIIFQHLGFENILQDMHMIHDMYIVMELVERHIMKLLQNDIMIVDMMLSVMMEIQH